MAKIDRTLFRPKDWIFVGPALAMAAASFTALFFIEGQLAGKIVTAATGATFLIMIGLAYLFRYLYTRPTYITRHGIHVVWGKKNKPQKSTFEIWTQKTIDHFVNAKLVRPDNGQILTRSEIEEALRNVKCFFADTPTVGSVWLMVRGVKKEVKFLGMAINNVDIYVGYWENELKGVSDWVRLVTKHELGHPLLGNSSFPSGPNFGDTHHQIFRETKFDCA